MRVMREFLEEEDRTCSEDISGSVGSNRHCARGQGGLGHHVNCNRGIKDVKAGRDTVHKFEALIT